MIGFKGEWVIGIAENPHLEGYRPHQDINSPPALAMRPLISDIISRRSEKEIGMIAVSFDFKMILIAGTIPK